MDGTADQISRIKGEKEMPAWVLALLLMLLAGMTGMVIGFVIGADSPPEDRERRREK